MILPLNKNIADTSGKVGETLVGRSPQEGGGSSWVCRTVWAADLPGAATLIFLQHVVHVQTYPDKRAARQSGNGLEVARWLFSWHWALTWKQAPYPESLL